MISSKNVLNIMTIAYLALFFAYLFLPLIFMGLVAFNSSSLPQVSPWEGFTLHWFSELFKDDQMWSALTNSVIVGVSVVCISVPVGLAAALMLTSMHIKAKDYLYAMFVSPILMPGIVLGISTFLFWDRAFLITGGLWTAIMAQSSFISAFCMLLIMARIQRFDRTQQEAAFDLGASHQQVFWKVTIPFLKPALFSSMALSFMQSFENYNTTLFAIGFDQTLPIYIGTKLRVFISPSMNALAVIFILLTIGGAVLYEYRRMMERRVRNELKKKEKAARRSTGGAHPKAEPAMSA